MYSLTDIRGNSKSDDIMIECLWQWLIYHKIYLTYTQRFTPEDCRKANSLVVSIRYNLHHTTGPVKHNTGTMITFSTEKHNNLL